MITRTRAAAGVRLVVAALGLGGCGLFPAAPAVPEGSPVECIGVPMATCDQVINDAGREALAQGQTLVRIRIRCISPAGCTEQSGEVQYEALLSNGSTTGGGFGWASPIGPPARPVPGDIPPQPPVPPTCQGVPLQSCRDMATGIDVGPDPSAVVSIVVRCTTICTLTAGEGTTVVLLKDGARIESSWSYSSGGP